MDKTQEIAQSLPFFVWYENDHWQLFDMQIKA